MIAHRKHDDDHSFTDDFLQKRGSFLFAPYGIKKEARLLSTLNQVISATFFQFKGYQRVHLCKMVVLRVTLAVFLELHSDLIYGLLGHVFCETTAIQSAEFCCTRFSREGPGENKYELGRDYVQEWVAFKPQFSSKGSSTITYTVVPVCGCRRAG